MFAVTSSAAVADRMIKAAVEQLHDSVVPRIDMEDAARRADVELPAALAIYPDEHALAEAIGNYGIARLSDSINRELATIAADDSRAALGAICIGYLRWARANPLLYQVISTRLMKPMRTASIVQIYDASFVPLVRRLLGETESTTTRRPVIGRAFLYGIADLALYDHLDTWMLPGAGDIDAELQATVAEFVDMMMHDLPPRPVQVRPETDTPA